MNYFLDSEFSEKQPTLSAQESKHALRSLRLKVDDELMVGDGNGTRYRCSLAGIEDNQARLNILEIFRENSPENRLTVAIAPTKNPSRFEWFLEKGTEMGIWEIIPIRSQHSERPRVNVKRAHKIIHAASKQSQRFFIPKLQELSKLKDLSNSQYDHCFIAHCDSNFKRRNLANALNELRGSILVLIGPEGDFSPEEIARMQEEKVIGVSLGTNRLRTETAGVFVAAIYSSSIH